MGWFWSSIESVVDVVVDVTDGVGNMCSKTWNSVTGRDDFEKAERLYNEIEEKYSKSKFDYEQNISVIANKIESKVSNINYHKANIYNELFPKFIALGNKIHNISIHGNNFLEYFDDSITKINGLSGLREKERLYTIDFNNLKFKEISLGILTLGFFTRKKAKETLIKVQEESLRINEEIQKMESQIIKAQVIVDSIDNVEEYFTVLIKNYSKLLKRFEYGINSQIQKNILKGNKLENGKLNFKLMPIAHIEEFQALFNLSIVLKQMASLGYLTESGEINNEDIESFDSVKSLVDINCLVA